MQIDDAEGKIFTCSKRGLCTWHDKEYHRNSRNIDETDQNIGVCRCNLYYGVLFEHLYDSRRSAALRESTLSCLRKDIVFKVVPYRKED